MNTESHAIRIRDIVRGNVYRLAGDSAMLRVPHDFMTPSGPVHYRTPFIEYEQAGQKLVGRVAPGILADAHPGERVLVHLPPVKQPQAEDEWRLCEIEEVDGDAVE